MSQNELSSLVGELFPESPATALAATEALLGALSGEEDSSLVKRARAGHSPSARALVNASDLVQALALESAPAEPRPGLRARIVADAEAALRAKSPLLRLEQAAGLPPIPREGRGEGAAKVRGLAPCEALAGVHQALADDVSRRERIASLGAAGVHGGVIGAAADDAELDLILARMAPFIEPGALFVSIVRGGETIHRVHRGFPAAFGNVDVVPRQISFCTHTISADEPFVVHDAMSEPFFRSAVVATLTAARTYVGVPLRVERQGLQRQGVGALCSIGWRPRRIQPSEVAFFSLFAAHAEAVVAGDAVSRARLCPAGVYDQAFFRELLGIEIARLALSKESGRSIPAPALLVLSGADRSKIAPEDLAGDLGDGRVAVLVGGAPRFLPQHLAGDATGLAAQERETSSYLERAALRFARPPAVLTPDTSTVAHWVERALSPA